MNDTGTIPTDRNIKACHCCGLIQRIDRGAAVTFETAPCFACPRCGTVVDRNSVPDHSARRGLSSNRTAAAAMGALLLFPAAISLPILEIEKLGHRFTSSILGGILELYATGSWFVATIVLVFSILLPIIKLVTLLELCWFRWLEHHHRALAYRMIEFSGRWSMMDVMLLAFLVMLVKLSGLVEFHVGSAAIAFAACVGMSMIASMSFDPHSIWLDEE